MANFYPPLSPEVKKSVFTALRTVIEKKVLQYEICLYFVTEHWSSLLYMIVPTCRSLAPLFDNAKLDKELRAMIKEHFSEFCASDGIFERKLFPKKHLLILISRFREGGVDRKSVV